ncbi:hypothetical protein G6011_03230 [Alternaria panax]|uniref:Uncharacterized protein n=1 Tax=Alternaria panax TaxID=48097 RepID=A0AAD4NTU0_9PLEO|nr:hypothetical protein G6011_03230 [Alternaria panax]
MTATFPEFVFPAPGPDLPSWPAVTDEPFKPGSNPSDHMRICLQDLLDDRVNYPVDGFGPGTAPVQVHDIIEPLFLGSNQEPDTAWTDYIHAVQLYCLVCPPWENGERREGTDDLGWPFCGGDKRAVQSTPPAFDQIINWAPQPDEVNPGIVVPKPSYGWENTSLACTLAMYMTFDMIDATLPLYRNRPSVKSQLFIVSSTPRDGASDFGVLMPYRYSAGCSRGAPNGTACNGQGPYSMSSYTPAPTSTQDMWDALLSTPTYMAARRAPTVICHQTRFRSCRKDGWYRLSTGQRVGIVIGAVVGFIIVILLFRCFARSKWSRVREKKRPMLLSELRSQQAAEQRAAAERRLHEEHASTSRESENIVEQSPEDVPPTYREAMKDNRPALAVGSPQVNGNASTAWPPVHQNVVRQPAPVARASPRVPYPTLPPSPRR